MRSRLAPLVALVVAVVGCATQRSVLDARAEGEGVTRVYAAPYAVVWVAVRDVLREAEAEDVEEHPERFYLTASHAPTAFSWGGYVGAFFEPLDPTHTRLTIVTKRRLATTIATPFDEDDLAARVAAKLPDVARRPELRYAYGATRPAPSAAPAAASELPPPPPPPPGASPE